MLLTYPRRRRRSWKRSRKWLQRSSRPSEKTRKSMRDRNMNVRRSWRWRAWSERHRRMVQGIKLWESHTEPEEACRPTWSKRLEAEMEGSLQFRHWLQTQWTQDHDNATRTGALASSQDQSSQFALLVAIALQLQIAIPASAVAHATPGASAKCPRLHRNR